MTELIWDGKYKDDKKVASVDPLYNARAGLDGLYRLLLSCGGHVFLKDLAECKVNPR